ncbi:hypothetical protein [Dolichospermum heterosporum]|uniref:DUF5666 domain-containing protein n=1 Tax=Dolichospermum heterosporum TAC447 TaxID=747523 RepID=A0ABY5M2K1_9CYAN|nr:hypothetical protein [Dolichospermum heterosporum]UUO17289.1 hypothetical protein NG743_10030 [Dolichospermum heterosporum TAC447]
MKNFLPMLVFVLLAAAGLDSYRSLPMSAEPASPWRNESTGLFKEAVVTRMGRYSDTIVLTTERGEVEVRANKAIGSEWVDVVVDPKGELVSSSFHKGVARACEESVRISSSGARIVGNQEITDAYGKPNGTYETVECK